MVIALARAVVAAMAVLVVAAATLHPGGPKSTSGVLPRTAPLPSLAPPSAVGSEQPMPPPAPVEPAQPTGPPAPQPTPRPTPRTSTAAVAPLAVTMVRTAGTIPAGMAEDLATVEGVFTVVAIGEQQHELVAVHRDGRAVHDWDEGWAVPIDILTVDPGRYAELLPEGPGRDAIAGLAPGEVLLGATEAQLRGIGAGARLALADGRDLLVAGVAEDRLVNAAGGLVAGTPHARFLAVGHDPDDAVTERIVDRAAQTGGHARVLGRAPWSVTWRQVAPLSLVKAAFGEFAYRPGHGRTVVIEPDWVDRHIVTRRVPVLGAVTCHTDVLDDLVAALAEIEGAGLAPLLDPGDFAGCFSPRRMGAGSPLSRHAFGIAVDVNATTNALGRPPGLDERIVQILRDHGFWWGGTWPRPDGMHFEHAAGTSEEEGTR